MQRYAVTVMGRRVGVGDGDGAAVSGVAEGVGDGLGDRTVCAMRLASGPTVVLAIGGCAWTLVTIPYTPAARTPSTIAICSVICARSLM